MDSLDLIFQSLATELQRAQHVLILSHKNPDPDTLGASCALAHQLERQGKIVFQYCPDMISEALHVIPGADRVLNILDDEMLALVDAVVAVDISDLQLVGLSREHISGSLYAIDHHATNKVPADLLALDITASSTCEIVFRFLKYVGWDIDSETASALLHGILSDTGAFTNGATNAGALKAAGDLLGKGGGYHQAMRAAVGHAPVSKLQLWGRALTRLQRSPESKIVMTCVAQDDIVACAATEEHAEGVANFLNALSGADMVCTWREHRPGEIKVSLRTTRSDVDVSAVAQRFSGGGHKKAAGFSFAGRISVDAAGQWMVYDESGDLHPLFARPTSYMSAPLA